MLNYKKTTMSSQKYINQDLPTASKTNYYENSPSRLQLSTPKANNKSLGKYDQKIRGVKNDINQIIEEVDGKRDMNANVVNRIRNVNADALGTIKDGFSTPKTGKRNAQQQFNNYDGYPAQDTNFMQSTLSNPTGINAYSQPYGTGKSINMQSTQPMDIYEQNLELRKSLNDQMKQNNELLRRVKYLQNQNDQLRTQLGLPLSNYKYNIPSVNYMSNLNSQRVGSQPEGKYTDINTRRMYQSQNPNQYKQYQQNYDDNLVNYPNSNNYNYQGSRNYPNNSKNYDNVNTYNSNQGLNYGSTQPQMTAKFGQIYPQTPTNLNRKYFQANNSGNQHNQTALQMFKQLQELKDQDEVLRQKTLTILKS